MLNKLTAESRMRRIAEEAGDIATMLSERLAYAQQGLLARGEIKAA